MTFTHGHSGYINYRCRCDICRAAQTEYVRNRRRAAALKRVLVEASGGQYVVEGVKHGASTYSNHSCRCEVCRDRWNAKNAAGRTRRAL